MIILAIVITFIATAAGCYIITRPMLKQRQKLDEDTLKQNIELHEKNATLSQNAQILYDKIISAKAEEDKCKDRIKVLTENTKTMEEQSELLYQKNLSIAKEHFENALEKESANYQEQVEKFHQELALVMSEETQHFQEYMADKHNEMNSLEAQVIDLQKIVDAAVSAAKRQEEINTQNDFYRIQLASWEINEIKALREVGSQLKNIEPLNKVIWKCYYEKPTTDMIGRVIGSGNHTGIYKITNIENKKCYVGQAVNLAERWKQHIKRGVGADTPTRNKLYPAMYEIGPENFTFEVLEECDNSLLNSREDYWQDFYKAKEFGYSIK